MEPKKHKKKIHYTLMIISDAPQGVKGPFCMGAGLALTLLLFFLAVIVAGGIYLSVGRVPQNAGATPAAQVEAGEWEAEFEKLTEENNRLTVENTELNEKITILSETITQQAKAQEQEAAVEEEAHLPKGFPLAGPAVILKSSETRTAPAEAAEEAENGNEEVENDGDGGEIPSVVFSASPGTQVVCSGSGRVASVETGEAFGHRVAIDHGNGYTSIYVDVSEPRVSEGDEVKRGQVLYEMQLEGEQMEYQIQKDEKYIDPLELMEIYG